MFPQVKEDCPARFCTPGGRQVGFRFLRDERPLPPDAYARADELCGRLRSLIADRVAFLARSGRDPAIHLPRGIWDLNAPLHAASRLMLSGHPDVVRHLRLYAQAFTGYQLVSLDRSKGRGVPRIIPADLDDALAAKAANVDVIVDHHLDACRRLPETLHISPPGIFGEVGWVHDGRIINHDTHDYLERLALLADCGVLWELRHRTSQEPAPRILEIGSGFGGLAYHLKKLLPRARYVCVDIPESLAFSSVYLTTLFPDEDNALVTPDAPDGLAADGPGVTFLPNFLFDDFVDFGRPFDLVINTLSMSEMAEAQVRHYCAGIAKLLSPDGVFFEQNHDNRSLGFLDARRIIAECLPYCVPLSSAVVRRTKGAAHLWSVRRPPRFPWIKWHEGLQEAELALQACRLECAYLRERNQHMEATRFWKIRTVWTRWKKAVGLPAAE
jgi:putative sugar O-methyltransferase